MEEKNELDEKLPANLNKLVSKLEIIKIKMSEHKKNMDDISCDLKDFEKIIMRMVKHHTKIEKKIKHTSKNKSGFANPSSVSNELCEFMGQPNGTLIARTEVTKYLNKYIIDNNLKHQTEKKYILPDESLWKILGEEARGQEITHFNIQKYMNKHFSRKNI
jgi:chromatin remodeling complex protein RSC6